MRDDRPRVIAVCVVLLLVGGITVCGSLLTRSDSWWGLLVGGVAMILGIVLIVILRKDPYGQRNIAGVRTPTGKAHILEFKVGEAEIHEISYRWDQVWGWLTIRVDGALVRRQLVTFTVRLSNVAQFEVGEAEKHVVRVEKKRPLFLSAALPQPIGAYVDGQLIASHDGVTRT